MRTHLAMRVMNLRLAGYDAKAVYAALSLGEDSLRAEAWNATVMSLAYKDMRAVMGIANDAEPFTKQSAWRTRQFFSTYLHNGMGLAAIARLTFANENDATFHNDLVRAETFSRKVTRNRCYRLSLILERNILK